MPVDVAGGGVAVAGENEGLAVENARVIEEDGRRADARRRQREQIIVVLGVEVLEDVVWSFEIFFGGCSAAEVDHSSSQYQSLAGSRNIHRIHKRNLTEHDNGCTVFCIYS